MRSFNVVDICQFGGIWYPSVLPVLISVFQRNRNRTGLIRTGQMCWRRQWQPIPVLLPGKYHGWRSLEGCSPWGRWGLDTTERLHFHFSLSCIGEGNGNPLQCSCLENPRDRGAWWAAVYGVAQSRTRLKWLSSSSSSNKMCVYVCVPVSINMYLFIYNKDLTYMIMEVTSPQNL